MRQPHLETPGREGQGNAVVGKLTLYSVSPLSGVKTPVSQ